MASNTLEDRGACLRRYPEDALQPTLPEFADDSHAHASRSYRGGGHLSVILRFGHGEGNPRSSGNG